VTSTAISTARRSRTIHRRSLSRHNSSIPSLDLRPDLFQRPLDSPAIEHLEVLVGHGVRVIDVGDLDHSRVEAFQDLSLVIHHDHAIAGILTRSPEIITLMSAD